MAEETKELATQAQVREIRLTEAGEPKLETLEDVVFLAKKLSAAGLQPPALDTPQKIFLALMFAKQLGLNPLIAIRQIYVVNGVPMIFGDQPLALVKRSGQLDQFKEEMIKNKDEVVIGYRCTSLRKGGHEVVTEFTVDDAKLAKLWGKSGPWSSYPKRMLKMRARSENLKDNFPDILGGIGILEYDGDHEEAKEAQPLKSAQDMERVLEAET